MKFDLPDLPYKYNALDPYIDVRTMEIHHIKHHGGYVEKLNAAIESLDFNYKSIEEILENINDIPEDKRQSVINSGGGHANHSLFWKIMSPRPQKSPTGEVLNAINGVFGGIDSFKEKFTELAQSRFGSGWAWLVIDRGNLELITTSNQDSPILKSMSPVMGLDVWEHAYYLKYQNRRGDYINAWWNILDWKSVEENYNRL